MDITDKITRENITTLQDNEIFVFGSNESGRHTRGASYLAMKRWGAIFGQASGLQGQCYGIPTKDYAVRNTLSLEKISKYVDKFLFCAQQNPHLIFKVTKIGCGLANLRPKVIAPLFFTAKYLNNVHLPIEFWEIIEQE